MVTIPQSYRLIGWYCLLIVLIAIPIFLIALPGSYFDEGTAKCLSVLIFNMECYGCGMTRAIMHLIHLDFESAAYYNPLSFIVFPVLSIVYLRLGIQTYKNIKDYRQQSTRA